MENLSESVDKNSVSDYLIGISGLTACKSLFLHKVKKIILKFGIIIVIDILNTLILPAI